MKTNEEILRRVADLVAVGHRMASECLSGDRRKRSGCGLLMNQAGNETRALIWVLGEDVEADAPVAKTEEEILRKIVDLESDTCRISAKEEKAEMEKKPRERVRTDPLFGERNDATAALLWVLDKLPATQFPGTGVC